MNKNIDLMEMAAGDRKVKVYTFKPKNKYDLNDFVPYEVKKRLAKTAKKKKLKEAA